VAWPDSFDEEAYEHFVDMTHIGGDSFSDTLAQDALKAGWFDAEVSPDERQDAREFFQEYIGDEFYDWADFWDEWRDWYGAD